jgi:hypothetical protein
MSLEDPMPTKYRLGQWVVSVAGSRAASNMLIGAGRAFDPHPIPSRLTARFAVRAMTFNNGFAEDQANLHSDRENGERRALGAIASYNGKTAAVA